MKKVENSYRLDNANQRLSADEIRKSLADFEYFMGHYQQIVNKERQTTPFKLNEFQKLLFATLLPMIKKETRLDKRHHVVVCKPRQVGASVGVVAFINYICAFVDGMNNLNIAHVFPVGDTITKFYNQKVEPIISGVHPDLFPSVERETLSSSILTHYKDIKGINRNNYYELISSNANSIRSSSIHVLLEDECLSGDVEILTDRGFKRLDSLDKTEKVAQYDMNNDGVSFVKPIRYIDREYNGDAYEWSRDGYTFVSTSRHAFVVGRRTGKQRNKNKFSRVEAHSVHTNNDYLFPTWGYGQAKHVPLSPIERLGIAIQADGSVIGVKHKVGKAGNNVGWTMCRIALKRQSKMRRLERLLDEAGLVYTKHEQKRKGYFSYAFDLPFENPKLLPSFLSVECSYERAREIIHEVLMWDGFGLDREILHDKLYIPRFSHYSSVVKENRDFVAAVAVQAGIQVKTGVQIDNRSETHKDIYRVYMTSRETTSYQVFKKTPINYEGRVYCVEVPSGCIVVRTGGKVWVTGNCSFYSKPEQLDSAIMPALPAYGFSLVVYLSTFEDRKSTYFQEKILTAQKNPEDWTLIFVPWYVIYPERGQGLSVDDVYLSEEEDVLYRDEVIIPNLIKDNIPKSRWGDCIDWYFKQKRAVPNIKMEFPTTIEEVLTMHAAKKVFSEETLNRHRKNLLDGRYYRLMEDPISRKVEARVEEDPTPLKIYRNPVYGHKYLLVADPITAMNEDTDIFAMMVFDTTNNEQVAVFAGKDYPVEDYASFAVNLAKIYNNAPICPESNVADAFVACIRAMGYYYFYYPNNGARARRDPGIRTTASSKPDMIDKLTLLLDNDRIIIHDKDTIDQLTTFEKRVKQKRDGGVSVKMEARAGHHDDAVAVCWIYAATLDDRQLLGHKRSGFAFL